MKKTFSTILATSCLLMTAQASITETWTTEDLFSANGALTIPSNSTAGTTYGNFSLTALLDIAAVRQNLIDESWSDSKHVILRAISEDGQQAYGLVTNGTSGSKTEGGIYGARGSATTFGVSNGSFGDNASASLEELLRSETTTYTSMAITMVADSSGLSGYFTLIDDQGNVTTSSNTLGGGWKFSSFGKLGTINYNTDILQALTLRDTALSSEEAFKANLSAIPEPTTATLSLLALAGLAARRRRK